jgi:formate hydrogenlyase subunit 3/multisubunit Na+/H+ antiporter MnhD subunit
MMNHWIMAPLLLPLLAGMLNLLVVRRSPGLQRVLSFAAAAGMVVAATVLVVRAGSGEIEVYRLGAWPAPFGIVLVLDRLSALLVLLTAVLALPTLLYATTGDDLRGPASDHFCPGPPLVQPTCLGVLFLIAAAASTGLPPLSGFIGKLLLMQAMEPQRAHWLWAVVLAGGLAGLVAWSRAGSLLFWETEGSAVSGSAAAVSRLLPVIVLVSISVPLTLFAAPITRYAEAAAVQLLAPQGYITAVLNPEKSP